MIYFFINIFLSLFSFDAQHKKNEMTTPKTSDLIVSADPGWKPRDLKRLCISIAKKLEVPETKSDKGYVDYTFRFDRQFTHLNAKQLTALFQEDEAELKRIYQKASEQKEPASVAQFQELQAIFHAREVVLARLPDPVGDGHYTGATLSVPSINFVLLIRGGERKCGKCSRVVRLDELLECKKCHIRSWCPECRTKDDKWHSAPMCVRHCDMMESMVWNHLRGGFKKCLREGCTKPDTEIATVPCAICNVNVYCSKEHCKDDMGTKNKHGPHRAECIEYSSRMRSGLARRAAVTPPSTARES